MPPTGRQSLFASNPCRNLNVADLEVGSVLRIDDEAQFCEQSRPVEI